MLVIFLTILIAIVFIIAVHHEIVIKKNLDPQAKSGQQEMLENIINKYL